MKLKQHSSESSKNCYWGYVISEKNEVNMPKKTERKFFLFYSLYAWCCPLVIVVVSMVFDLMPIIPSSYLKPNIGDNKCWFSSKWHDFVVISKTFEQKSLKKKLQRILCMTCMDRVFFITGLGTEE
jgi:hypothetical protein